MANVQAVKYYETLVEKIIFNEDELETLKIAIKNFTEGKTNAKELKELLLQCRGRMVEDISELTFMIAQRSQAEIPTPQSASPTKVESQLRKEIQEKNELLETVARRVGKLVSKLSKGDSSEDQKLNSIDEVKEEIERCLNQIGAKEWIDMCYYADYKFFAKLYPKLEELYEERFGEIGKNGQDASEGKEIMANKMTMLGFPEDIETIVIKYIVIRNKFHHSMVDLTPSNLGLAREAFAKVLVHLIVSNLEPELLLNNRESFYAVLTDFFTRRLTGNPAFRKRIIEEFEIAFQV